MKNQTLENQNADIAGVSSGIGAIVAITSFCATGRGLSLVPANSTTITGSSTLSGGVGISASGKSAPESPTGTAPKHSDGWDGNAFYFCGKQYVVAICPAISKNGLHELRTYCFASDKQAVPSEKLTTIVT